MGDKNCFQRMRESAIIVVIVVFLSLLTDSLLLTLVDPILPDILSKIDGNDTDEIDIHDINTNGKYGYLVAAKGAAQFVCNPFVGLVVNKVGYRKLMFIGDFVLMLSSIAFAYGQNYLQLFIIRIFQGVSSSVTAVTGMSLLAATFTNDEQRGTFMGIAIGGLSLGIIVGPIYGSLLYQFVDEAFPFLLLGGMVAITLVLQAINCQPDANRKDHSMKSILQLVSDPLILIVAGNIFILNLDVSVVLAFLPLRLLDLTDAPTWQLGVVVLPTSIGYLAAGFIFPRIVNRFPRWSCAMAGMIVAAGTLMALTFSKTLVSMSVVTAFLGLALGMVSTSMQPAFASLVDLRHSSLYGNVYALSDMSVCLAMTIGPLAGGPILYVFGFEWMVLGVGVLNFVYAQFALLLRHIPSSSPSQASSQTRPLSEESEVTDTEDVSEESTLLDLRHRHNLEGSTRLPCTMDLSHVPVPRYIDCLSGVEDFYSDPEGGRPLKRQKNKQRYHTSPYI